MKFRRALAATLVGTALLSAALLAQDAVGPKTYLDSRAVEVLEAMSEHLTRA